MNRALIVGAVVVGGFLIAQLIPVPRENPPVAVDVGAPEAVRATLRASCYDCHSHETRWPWYSRIAPVSWVVARDVVEGREHLNFSTWDGYSAARQQKLLGKAGEEIREGEMPTWGYRLAHPEARLSVESREALLDWLRAVSPSAGPDHEAGSEE